VVSVSVATGHEGVAPGVLAKKDTAFLVSPTNTGPSHGDRLPAPVPRKAERLRDSFGRLRAGDTERHDLAE
jgi:hypothetical protein